MTGLLLFYLIRPWQPQQQTNPANDTWCPSKRWGERGEGAELRAKACPSLIAFILLGFWEGLNCAPLNLHTKALRPSHLECDCIWRPFKEAIKLK
jgi:hypothetical protein